MYVYTPIHSAPRCICPGKGLDEIASAEADVGPGCRVLRYDEGVRFVLWVQPGTPLQPGWAEKSVDEVFNDYPGLV